MSLKRMSAVWDDSKASGSTLLLLLAIADNASDDGLAWPGIETLVKRSRLGKRAVIKQLKRVEEMGELRIFRRPGQHNFYIVDVGLTDEQRKSAIETLAKKVRVSVEELTSELCAPVITSSPTGEPEFTSPLDGGEPEDTTTGEPEFTRSVIGTVSKDRTIKEPEELAPAAQESPNPTDAPKPLTPHQRMFGAVCDAWGYNLAALTKSKRGQINGAVGELTETNAMPEDMPAFKAWLDAKVKAGEWRSYTVSAMAKYWPDFEKEYHAPPPAPIHMDLGTAEDVSRRQDEMLARFNARVAAGEFDDAAGEFDDAAGEDA